MLSFFAVVQLPHQPQNQYLSSSDYGIMAFLKPKQNYSTEIIIMPVMLPRDESITMIALY